MSKVVFVGNVPYNMGEDQLIDVFKSVGTVVGFRLVFDRETGKPRGYGFCEFADHETALSAVRNLNNVDCGGRPLRIDLADSDPFLEGKTTMRGELIDSGGGSGSGGGGGGGWRDRDRHRDDRDRDFRGKGGGFGHGGAGDRGGGSGSGDGWLNALPRGTPLPPGAKCMDAISQVVASVRPAQMMEILSSMKAFVLEQPDRAHALLSANPQLAYALFQALLVNQIVDPAILHRMIAATAMQNAAPPAPAPPPHMLPPPTQPTYAQPPPAPPTMYQTPPPPMGYPPATGPATGYYPPPPPPPHVQPPPTTDPAGSVPDAQRAMLMQMLQLTNEQINALPPNERQAIQQLRNQFMALGSNIGS